MQNLSSVQNVSSLGASGGSKWYKNNAYKLNGVLPALIHDYEKNRYYNTTQKTHSFPFSATRTTNATQFDAQGRLVWAPANLLIRSDDLTLSWTATDTTITTDGTIAPSGSLAQLATEGSAGTALVSQQATGAANAPFCYTIETKKGNCQFLRLRIGNGSDSVSAWLDYDAGTITSATLAGTATAPAQPVITNIGSGWYRCSVFVANTTANPVCLTNTAPSSGATTRVNGGSRYMGRQVCELYGVDSPKLPLQSTGGSAYYGHRLDYNSATLASRGLLVEGAGTNVLTYARDKGTSFTAKTDITTAIDVTDVSDVANSATRMTEGTAGTAILTADGGSVTAGSTITASILVKSTGASPVTWVRVGCVASGLTDGAEAWFNVASGTLGTVSVRGAGTLQTAAITALRDGWYRLEVTSKPNAGYTVPCIFICSASADASSTRVNNSTYAIDYAQLEVGSAATSIIPTYAASATRAADTCTLTTGAWLSQTNNTWFLKFIPGRDLSVGRRFFALSDGTTNNLQGALRSLITISQNWSSIAAVPTFGPNTANGSTNFAISKSVHQYANTPAQAVCLNGGSVVTSVAAVATSGYSTLDVGKTTASASANLNGWILEFRNYADASASGAQLQTLTT